MNDFLEFIQNDLSLLPEMLRMSHEDFNTLLDVSELSPELTLWESTDSKTGKSGWSFCLSHSFLKHFVRMLTIYLNTVLNRGLEERSRLRSCKIGPLS